MTEPELKQVLMEAEELPKVMKQVDMADIRKMTKETLKEVVEDIMEDHEEDLEEMKLVVDMLTSHSGMEIYEL